MTLSTANPSSQRSQNNNSNRQHKWIKYILKQRFFLAISKILAGGHSVY